MAGMFISIRRVNLMTQHICYCTSCIPAPPPPPPRFRNIVSVLNRSPPALLGEILLVDDMSSLEELHEGFERHLEVLRKQLPPGLIRAVRRDIHDGIVGARNRGADEAKHEIILFLDSHAEVAEGWLTPLVARIHEDPTRVVVPNIRGFNLDSLKLMGGEPWPPNKGTFSWRLAYKPVMVCTRACVHACMCVHVFMCYIHSLIYRYHHQHHHDLWSFLASSLSSTSTSSVFILIVRGVRVYPDRQTKAYAYTETHTPAVLKTRGRYCSTV